MWKYAHLAAHHVALEHNLPVCVWDREHSRGGQLDPHDAPAHCLCAGVAGGDDFCYRLLGLSKTDVAEIPTGLFTGFVEASAKPFNV